MFSIRFFLALGAIASFSLIAEGRNLEFFSDSDANQQVAPHHHKAHHHKIHQNEIAPVSDNDKEAVMYCMTRANVHEKPHMEPCTTSMESPMGPKPLGLACMSIFSADLQPIKQGCWVHQKEDVIDDQCQVGSCVAEAEGSGPFFCCCQGDMCNKHFALTAPSVFADQKF